jgi:hypothetical protein
MARRQIQGSVDAGAVGWGLQWAASVGEFTCNVVESFHPNGEILTKLAEAYAEDPITPSDLANPAKGSSALFTQALGAPEQMGGTHWLARLFLLKRNKTLNLHNRELVKLMESGLASTTTGANYVVEYLHRPEWEPRLANFNNLAGIGMAKDALRIEGYALSDSARQQLFQTRALRVWLAIRRWELQHPGQKLRALTDLPGDLLTTIPQDPWTGQPLTWDPATEQIQAVGGDWKPGPALFRAGAWFDLDWETAALRLHRPAPPPKVSSPAATRP